MRIDDSEDINLILIREGEETTMMTMTIMTTIATKDIAGIIETKDMVETIMVRDLTASQTIEREFFEFF